jgi:hypothetical protein
MLESINNFFNNKTRLWKIIALISMVLFFIVLVFLSIRIFCAPPFYHKAKPIVSLDEKINILKCDDCVRRNIDGVYVKPEEVNLPPVAVMIDNHPDARPHYGIEKASLVYEAEVEGNYTRLMAVFASNDKIEAIGPVRSARPYFVAWAEDLNAVYTHCGGSPEALVDLAQKDMVDLNEFYNGQYFWRTKDKIAPHNILTSSENLNKFLENKKITSGNYLPWRFKDDSPLSNSSSSPEIKINYNLAEFKVKWVYNSIDNDYVRYLGDSPELSADGNQFVAKNIIIQAVPAKVIDDKLRLKMDTVGKGSAVLCQDGKCQEGGWSKNQTGLRTKFTYPDGEEMQFNAGPTWVEVVRPEIKIEY